MKNCGLISIVISLSFATKVAAQTCLNPSSNNKFTLVSRNPLPTDSLSMKAYICDKPKLSRKNSLFFYWGYNRDMFTKSDIHFHGDGYNFYIKSVRAHDDQWPFSSVYINPTSITWPQYNYRLGYYINDKTFISVGEDHMKYKICKQPAYITGYINNDNNGGTNTGTYNNAKILVGENGYNASSAIPDESSLKDGFVSDFENCDGLNDVALEVGRIVNLWLSKNGAYAVSAIADIGAGIEVVDTEAEILGYTPSHNYNNHKTYHLAGYSISSTVGLEFTLFRNLFLMARIKGGFVNLPNINTTIEGGKANQHFGFMESMAVIGYSYTIGKKH